MDLDSFLRYLPYLHETSKKWPPDMHYSSGYQQKRKVQSNTLFPKTYAVSIEPLASSENVGTCYFRYTSSSSSTSSRSTEAAIGGALETASLVTTIEAIVFLTDMDASATGEHWAIVASPSGSTTTAGTTCSPSSDSTKPPPPSHFMRHNLYAMERSHRNQKSDGGEQPALFFRFNNRAVFYVDYSQIKSVQFDKVLQNSSSPVDSLLIEFDCCYFRVYNGDDSPEGRRVNATTNSSDSLSYAKCLLQKYLLGRKCQIPWESLTVNYPLNIRSVGTSSETLEQGSASDPSSSHEPGQQQETTDHSIGQPASQNSTLSFPGSEGSPSSTTTGNNKPMGDEKSLATGASATSSPILKTFQSVYDIPSDYLAALPNGAQTILHSANLLLPSSLKKRKQQIKQNCDAIDSILQMAQQRLPQQNPVTNAHYTSEEKSSLIAQMFAVLEKNSVTTVSDQQGDLAIFEENYDHAEKRLKEDVEKCFFQLFPPSRARSSQPKAVTAPPSEDPSEVFQNAEKLIQLLKVSAASRHLFAMNYCYLKN
jgi:hypothetical protein